jgi:serine/threonine-protein kinase
VTESQGTLLAGRYRLGSLIAGGGMGQVWRGRDTMLDRPVAVKVLRDQFAGDPTFRARFRAEAQHAATLVHPHIAAVFDYGEVHRAPGTSPVAYLVMELVEGESLADVLRRERRLDASRTLDVLRQAADGLGAAHAAGVVHRDIKPANLLVTPDGRVKLTDFGIARSAASVAITATGQVLGTAHYLSPEQASGQPASPASDVYALGTVGYECLAGRRAFEGESAVQIAVMQIRDQPDPLPDDVPGEVRELIGRAMAKDPATRYPDGAALRDAVDGVGTGTPSAVPPARTAVLPAVTTTPPPATAVLPAVAEGAPARPRRRRWPLAALLAVLLLAGVGGALALALRDDTTPGGGGTTTQEETAPTTPAGVDVVPGDLVGRPVQEVEGELLDRGLRVELVAVETGEVAAGLVTAVDPAGTLARDATVRLSYATAPPPPPAPAPEPAPAPDPADEDEADEDEADEDERGNGRGNTDREERGNGQGRGRGGDD